MSNSQKVFKKVLNFSVCMCTSIIMLQESNGGIAVVHYSTEVSGLG